MDTIKDTINKRKFWNEIEKQFWKYYSIEPKNQAHLAAINNYLEGLIFSQKVLTGEEAQATFDLCWFCNFPLNEEGIVIDEHHVLGRKDSPFTKIVHKSCHIEFHKHWKRVDER